jgi:integrase
MASIFNRKGKIYISWYDSISRKRYCRSTGLKFSKENMKTAKMMVKNLEIAMKEEKQKLADLKLKRSDLQGAFDHFKNINSNKNPRTIYEYDRFYKLFQTIYPASTNCSTIDKLGCEHWLASLRNLEYSRNNLPNQKKRKYSQNTLHTYNKVLKKFLSFLFEYDYTKIFILNKDVVFRPEIKPIVTFSDDDLKILIENLNEKNSNFTITIYLLLYTGLRPSDIYNIKTEDINLNDSIIQYYSEKSDDYYLVPIHGDLKSLLKDRMKEIGEGPLLEYETISNIGKAFRRYMKKLNLDKKGYTLRTFRKTFISLGHDAGIDLATISRLVGHKQITTTQKYYNKLSIGKQKDELKKIQFPGTNQPK